MINATRDRRTHRHAIQPQLGLRQGRLGLPHASLGGLQLGGGFVFGLQFVGQKFQLLFERIAAGNERWGLWRVPKE